MGKDVSPNIFSEPILLLPAANIRPGILLRHLRDIMAADPYHVGINNCHHAALAAYNHCATKACKLDRLPVNRVLSGAANVLGYVGLDVGAWRSESAGIHSTSSQHTIHDKERVLEQCWQDGSIKGEENPHVVAEWKLVRDAAAPGV